MIEHVAFADNEHVARQVASRQVVPGVGDLRLVRRKAKVGQSIQRQGEFAEVGRLDLGAALAYAEAVHEQMRAVGQRNFRAARIASARGRFDGQRPNIEHFSQRHFGGLARGGQRGRIGRKLGQRAGLPVT